MAVALLLALAACGSDPAPPRAEPTPTTTSATPSPTPEPEPQPVFWPLTGRETAALPQRPALAVKIENSIAARPQTGLNAADMVWEEVVEGGITRFVAVYHSTLPSEIGPVRSVRPMDPGIAAPLQGLFAFSGGQGPFVDAVGAAGLQVVSHDAGAAGFYRTDRGAPHNIYASPRQLLEQADAEHRAGPPPQFVIAGPAEQPSVATAGRPTAVLRLTLTGISRPSWTWSRPDGAWLRAEDEVPAVEADGTRLRATNVVVLRVDVVSTPFVDAIGTRVPETVMVASGQALVATGGRSIAATWAKPSLGAPVALTGPDGAPVRLAPGPTWVELVPNGTGAVTAG